MNTKYNSVIIMIAVLCLFMMQHGVAADDEEKTNFKNTKGGSA